MNCRGRYFGHSYSFQRVTNRCRPLHDRRSMQSIFITFVLNQRSVILAFSAYKPNVSKSAYLVRAKRENSRKTEKHRQSFQMHALWLINIKSMPIQNCRKADYLHVTLLCESDLELQPMTFPRYHEMYLHAYEI